MKRRSRTLEERKAWGALVRANKRRGAGSILTELAERPDIAPYAYLVGRWVWVTFTDPPGRETRNYLKTLGFVWSDRRGSWLHAGGVGGKRRKDNVDPRNVYGVDHGDETEHYNRSMYSLRVATE